MWLSEQAARHEDRESGGAVGVVTIAGRESAVEHGSETRGVPVVSPGGLAWLPETDREVVTLWCGDTGPVLLGVVGQVPPAGMEPGELCLYTENTEVCLKQNGEITLRGAVNVEGSLTVNGVPVEGGGEDGTEAG